MKGVSRVLYNLPAVIKASVVFFVEGEKAADALAKLDFTVTTSPGGAKKVPSLQEKDQILDTLQKKIVIIWPDNDPAGHKHAQQVAKLLHGKADAVFIIEPTGQPEKGDAYDFIEEHGPEEAEKRINELCNKAELWEPSSAESQEEDGSAKANEPSSITKVIDGGLVTTHYNSASTHHQAEDPEPVEQEETETNHPALDFPTEIMGGVAGDFAELYSQYLEVPIHFLYIGFLACLGSFLANTLTLATELETQPRLYILLLGASADDRKSTAIKKVVDFFKDTMQDFMVCWGVGSAEGLQKLFVKNPNLLLALDEFKSFVSKCKIDASVLLPMVTTLFESNNYEAHTKQKSIVLEQVNLSILAASTIETYEHTWDTSFTDIGFNNRTFIVPGSGKRMFSFPKKVPANEKVSLQRGLRDILRFVGSERELDITPAGFNIYDKWYINQDRSVHTKRLDGYALRFMSLLAANESKPEIDEDIVRKAIKLVDWQLEVRRHHDPIDADNVQAKMEEKIRRVLSTKGPQTNRGLKQLTNANRAGLWIYNNAKDNLRRENDILLNKETKRWETGPGQPNVKP
jgi:5S rRNA maturation endonuclease (ribonuclease M5)